VLAAEALLETLAEVQLIDPSPVDGAHSPRYACLTAIAQAAARLPLTPAAERSAS